MIKLIVSDLDGTLLDEYASISKNNLIALSILKKQNIEFIIATGRDYQGIESIKDKYQLSYEAILGNGAQYVDKYGNVLMNTYLKKEYFKQIHELLTSHHIPFYIYTTNGFYTTYEISFVRNEWIKRGVEHKGISAKEYDIGGKYENSPCNYLKRINNIDEFINSDINIIKFEVFSVNIDSLEKVGSLLNKINGISNLSSFTDIIEITDQYAQKGYILEKVIESKKLNKNEVVVIGDGMNDLSMFELFGYSFAPSNAIKQIRDMAYKVVENQYYDGVSKVISQIILMNNNCKKK